jgi:hypothetical protein
VQKPYWHRNTCPNRYQAKHSVISAQKCMVLLLQTVAEGVGSDRKPVSSSTQSYYCRLFEHNQDEDRLDLTLTSICHLLYLETQLVTGFNLPCASWGRSCISAAQVSLVSMSASLAITGIADGIPDVTLRF